MHYKTINNHVFEVLKINFLTVKLNVAKHTVHLSTETEQDIQRIANSNFEELGIPAIAKILTNNYEFDSKKVKIFHSSPVKIDMKQFRACVSIHGGIEELYEAKVNSRKWIFIVALNTVDEKTEFIKKISLLVASQMFQVEEYRTGPSIPPIQDNLSKCIIQVALIRVTNTEFS